MLQLQPHQQKLVDKNTAVLVLTFEELWRAKQYVEEVSLPWPLLVDGNRQMYRAYGMGRGRVRDVMGWSSWGAYLRLITQGRSLRRPTADVYQLGGDVLIDPIGNIRKVHVAERPVDRPPVETVMQWIDEVNAEAS